MSVSLAFVIILTSWLVNIVRMGREHDDYKNIYAVCYGSSLNSTWALGEHLVNTVPEVESSSAMLLFGGHFSLADAEYVKINWCEENFFEYFPQEFIEGNSSFLKVPSEVGISETYANTHYPDGDAVGKTVTLVDKDYVISAIYKDYGDGLLKYNDMIMAMSVRGKKNPCLPIQETMEGMVTMIKVKEGSDIEEVSVKVYNEIVSHYKEMEAAFIEAAPDYDEEYFEIQKNYHNFRLIRYDHITYDWSNRYFTSNTPFTIAFISILVGLLLVMAVMNYVNLNVALSGKRAKEAATRNLLGSQKGHLFLQYFKEAFAMTAFCTVAGICIAYAILPGINEMLKGYEGLGSRFSISLDLMTSGCIVLLMLIVSSVTGFIPAFYVSRFSAVDVTKGKFRHQRKATLSKVFICLQSVFATIFITFSIFAQVEYSNRINTESGCDEEDLFYLEPSDNLDPEEYCTTHYDGLLDELRSKPEIIAADYTIGTIYSAYLLALKTERSGEEFYIIPTIECTPESFQIYGFEVIERNNDLDHGLWMNEQGIGICENDPEILEELCKNNDCFNTSGIIRDYAASIVPLPKQYKTVGFVLVKPKEKLINHNTAFIIRTIPDHEKARKVIADAYEKISGCMVTDPKHFGRNALYLTEIKKEGLQTLEFIRNIVSGITIIIVIITILGLTGISVYHADENTHEIAVRKVFGGSIGSETRRNVWTFMKLTLIANLIAVPIIIFMTLKQVLFQLEYIGKWEWYIVLAVLLSFAISLAAVLIQTLRAARTNPAEALKKE